MTAQPGESLSRTAIVIRCATVVIYLLILNIVIVWWSWGNNPLAAFGLSVAFTTVTGIQLWLNDWKPPASTSGGSDVGFSSGGGSCDGGGGCSG